MLSRANGWGAAHPASSPFFIESVVTFAVAGATVGALETAVGLTGGDLLAPASLLYALTTAVSFMALVGTALGALVAVTAKLTASAYPIRYRTLGAVVVPLAAAIRLPWEAALVMAVVAVAVAALAVKRNSPALLTTLVLWGIVLAVLKPFFTGFTLTLVFTPGQSLLILLGAMTGLFLAVGFVVYERFGRLPEGRLAVATIALTATAAALALAVGSSVFMIRLWGFNTMGYLQGVVVALWIGAATVPLGIVIRRLAPRRAPIMKGIALAATPIVLLVALAGAEDPRAIAFIAERTPTAGALQTMVAMAFDRDGDGASPLFGFGDCDDTLPLVGPAAIDIPGDGRDQNCFGGDVVLPEESYFTLSPDVVPPTPVVGGKGRVVVFVIVDTLRADMAARTPTLTAIGDGSARFTRAYAQANNTLESTPFFFQLGFRNLPTHDSRWMLVPHLKAAGVRTVALFQASVPEWWGALGLSAKLFPFDETLRPRENVRNFGTANLGERGVEALDGWRPGENLFLFIHYEALHDAFSQMLKGSRMTAAGVNADEAALLMRPKMMASLLKDHYAEVLSLVDASLAPLWRKFLALERETDALFIVASDHGEEFYEHGGLFHMGALYDETTRVPLTIRGGGLSAAPVATPVGNYRVPATILDFFGFTGEAVERLSLLRPPYRPYEVFSHFTWGIVGDRRVFMIVDEGYKMIYDPWRGSVRLFDLAADPAEKRNLAGDPAHAAIEERLTKKMDGVLYYMSYGDRPYARGASFNR
jgi:hypothetical protein